MILIQFPIKVIMVPTYVVTKRKILLAALVILKLVLPTENVGLRDLVTLVLMGEYC